MKIKVRTMNNGRGITMVHEIKDIPDIPEGIFRAAQRGKLVLFIGAGVSRIVGCPSWKELAIRYLDDLHKKHLINYFEYERLKSLDAKKLLSICFGLYKERNVEPPRLEEVIQSRDTELLEKDNIYKSLYAFNAIYITTNYDDYLDEVAEKSSLSCTNRNVNKFSECVSSNISNINKVKKKVFYHVEELLVSKLEIGNIIHLHGSIRDEKSAVITVVDYIRHYRNNSKPAVFLEEIFREYTVLFIGYGLEEYEILEFLLSKSQPAVNEIRHYMLYPMFRSEANLLEHYQRYYDSLGIQLIPYPIDENGYYHLVKIIKEWSKKIGPVAQPQKFYDKIKQIDKTEKALQKKEMEKTKLKALMESVLDLISKDKNCESYFFENVYNLEWFVPLKERGYFSPSSDLFPYPSKRKGYYVVPFWNVLTYLKKVSNAENNEKYVDELLNIIREVSNYKDPNGNHIDNYRIWYYFVKILLNLPNEKIPLDIIELIPIWLDSRFDTTLQGALITTELLPKFLTDEPEDVKKAEKIIEYITALKIVPSNESANGEKKNFVVSSHYLLEVFEKYGKSIGKKCSMHLVEVLIDRVRKLLKNKFDGTLSSFYEKCELSPNPLDILTFAIKRILLVKAKENVEEVGVLLEKFLKENKFLYFPKMALFIIGQNMDRYERIFWDILGTNAGDNILKNTLSIGDELRRVLENLKELDDEHRNILDEKIKRISKEKFENEEDAIRYRQKIYKALSHDEYFKKLYDDLREKTQVDLELSPAIGKLTAQWITKTSPLKEEEILQIPSEELADYLLKFKATPGIDGPSIEGLAETLMKVAKISPEKFVGNMAPFKNVNSYYIYHILEGLRERYKEKKDVDLETVFEFLLEYVKHPGFQQSWQTTSVSDLIIEIVIDSTTPISKKLLKVIRQILALLIDIVGSDEEQYESVQSDYMFFSLNTPLGRILEALILFMFRVSKQLYGNKKESYLDELRRKFEKLLNEKIIEAYVYFGYYLYYLYSTFKSWTEKWVKLIENERENQIWEAFMCGYLYNSFCEKLYGIMKPHYQAGINHIFKDDKCNDRLIQHISTAYLKGYESLDNTKSLFKQIIDMKDHYKFREIINFFWMQRRHFTEHEKDAEQIRKRIIDFWRYMFKEYGNVTAGQLTDEDKTTLSDMSKLTIFLPEINDEFYEWLKLSAPYTHINFNNAFFIEYLDSLKNKGNREKVAMYIGNIFVEMLNSYTPDYPKDRIKSIVEFLYTTSSQSAKQLANKICNKYGEKGQLFLRELYKKYQGNE